MTVIYVPCNLSHSVELPSVPNTVWQLQDGTIVTELPQNLTESVLITRIDQKTDFPELYFDVTGAAGHSRYVDIYKAQNEESCFLDTLFDSIYNNQYQTLFLLDPAADLSGLCPEFDSGINTEIFVQGQENQKEVQTSGVSVQDFTHSPLRYTAGTADSRKDYYVTFAKRESGPRLFVNGPAEREIFLTDYFNNVHDILVANAGDGELAGLKAELLDAVNVKLDLEQPLASSLAAFARVPGREEPAASVMANFGKVRLVPDGEGEISGTLRISADGQEPVTIQLTGYSNNPRIITTTESLNMDDVIRVKYVPYSYTVETNNSYDGNRVTFSVAEGRLAEGLQMHPDTGEIYGVPLEAGEFPITVRADYSRPEFLPSYARLTLTVKDNTDDNVGTASDTGYELIRHIENIYLRSMEENSSQMLVSRGEHVEFVDIYLDGRKLVRDEEYTSESGSTRITILNQTLARNGVGTHTLGIEFRTQDSRSLKRAAQNYTVTDSEKPGGGNQNGDDDDSGEDSGDDSGESGNNDDPGSHGGGNSGGNSGSGEGGSGENGGNGGSEDNSGNGGSGADALNASGNGAMVTYVVMRGDSLWKIAARFYGSGELWRRIYEENAAVIRNPGRIYAGQVLYIRMLEEAEPEEENRGRRIYKVQPGDNLWKIAWKVYGSGELWRNVYEENTDKIRNPWHIRTGQELIIPER